VLQPPQRIGAGRERTGHGEAGVLQERLQGHADQRLVFNDHATRITHATHHIGFHAVQGNEESPVEGVCDRALVGKMDALTPSDINLSLSEHPLIHPGET
jgi:hypothetical protein